MPDKILELEEDECREKLEDWLEKQHPNWSEEKIEHVAEQECKKGKGERETREKQRNQQEQGQRNIEQEEQQEDLIQKSNTEEEEEGESFSALERQAMREYSNEVDWLLNNGRVKDFNRKLRINAWSTIAKLLVYLAIPGLILFIFNLFRLVPYAVNWFYILFSVFLLGFITAPPGKQYNYMLVLGIFLVFVFIPTPSFQLILSAADTSTPDPGSIGFTDAITKLSDNPVSNVMEYTLNFIHVLNWIVFIAMIGIGGSTIGDFLSGDWGKIAEKAAMIAAAVGIMTFVYSMFNGLFTVEIPAVWDTVGKGWNDLLEGIGLAQLSQAEDGTVLSTINGRTVGLGFVSWVPILFPFFLIGGAVGLRKTDFKSALFVRYVRDDETSLKVEENKWTNIPNILIASFMALMLLYLMGYVLVNGEQRVVISPIVTLGFYIAAFAVLFLVFLKILILNTFESVGAFIKNLILWSVFGLMILYVWFQVLQPVFYQANLADSPDAILIFSQTGSVFENDALEQLFIVATPETLVFQVLFIGLGNRIYYRIRKGAIIKKEKDQLIKKKTELAQRKEALQITNSMSQQNLRRIVLYTLLKQKIDKIDRELSELETQIVPIKYFILPTILFGMLGSFFFSTYHTLRRGINLIYWWRHPLLGLVYFGAGMVLSLISFFCWPAAILVHACNNIIAILLGG